MLSKKQIEDNINYLERVKKKLSKHNNHNGLNDDHMKNISEIVYELEKMKEEE